jgi:uncharacterized protein DUF2784
MVTLCSRLNVTCAGCGRCGWDTISACDSDTKWLLRLHAVPLVYLGAARHWAWVRSWRWRLLDLGAIVVISAESLLGIDCPLTVWEDTLLRRQETATGFIAIGVYVVREAIEIRTMASKGRAHSSPA